jgi:hypothetical protein
MPTDYCKHNIPNGPMAINLDSGVTLTKGGGKRDDAIVVSRQLKGAA